MVPSLYTIKGIVVLDNDGNRIWAKYYDPDMLVLQKEQLKFEKRLFAKTSRVNVDDVEIVMLDNMTILYKSKVDL